VLYDVKQLLLSSSSSSWPHHRASL